MKGMNEGGKERERFGEERESERVWRECLAKKNVMKEERKACVRKMKTTASRSTPLFDWAVNGGRCLYGWF